MIIGMTMQRFMDLGKLNFLMVVWFLAEANFHYWPSCLKKKKHIQFKSGQNRLEKNHLALLIYIYDTLFRIFEILAFDLTDFWHKKTGLTNWNAFNLEIIFKTGKSFSVIRLSHKLKAVKH